MKTVTLQIGNSDDKLTQLEWATFIARVKDLLEETAGTVVHFFGCSYGIECWQNACWVFETENPIQICVEMKKLREKYKQDSVAWTEGGTAFI